MAAEPRLGARRTRPALLAAVVAEVGVMSGLGIRGPVSLLVERLAGRGVRVTEATLRSGDCRMAIDPVWDRRLPSVRRFGPTGGHDMRPVEELVEHVIDLRCRIGRVRADTRGAAFDRGAGAGRDVRSLAACAKHEGDVRRRAALIVALLPDMAKQGVFPDFNAVSNAMGNAGEPLSARTLRRNDVYSGLVLAAQARERPTKPVDHERASLLRKSAEELGALVFALIAELAAADAEFISGLALDIAA